MSFLAVSVPKPASVAAELLDLSALRAGDGAARAAVYRRYAPVVHGIAVAVAGPGEAEDLTQDVFVKVFERIDELREDAAFGAWICGVTRNAARDRLRGRRRAGRELAEEPAAPAERGDDELAERVLALVRTLPDAYRETLVLRLVEGLSGPEIAARTGLTHGSVRVNLHRGMALLRPLLAKEGWR